MRIVNFLFPVFSGFAISLLVSCAGSQQMGQMQQDASVAYKNGEFEKALLSYESIISQQKSRNSTVSPEIYKKAGFAAWELKQTNKSLEYLEQVRTAKAADAKTFFVLACAYKEINNLSKEITCLETYTSQFADSSDIQQVKAKLFLAYVESENWEPASQLWEGIDEKEKLVAKNMEGYLKVLQKTEKLNEMEKVAKQVLKSDANNLLALEVLAEKYYYKAENRYKEEMQAYENKKNNKQYQILLKALKEINEDFKVSRDYFLKLYKLKPEPRYATLLGNIYIRFDNKEKAEYYYKLGKKK